LHTTPVHEQSCMYTSKMIRHRGVSLSIADLMIYHDTQTIDNSRICHCLLFQECGKSNFQAV